MSQHRSFVLAAALASLTVAAPAFADPIKPAPVAMSSTRPTDREVPVVVDHPSPVRRDPAVAPVRAPIVGKAGFAQLPASEDATAGFGVQISAHEITSRHGFRSDAAVPTPDLGKFGFAVVVRDHRM